MGSIYHSRSVKSGTNSNTMSRIYTKAEERAAFTLAIMEKAASTTVKL